MHFYIIKNNERIGRIYIICCLNNIIENPSLNFTQIITEANGKLATPEIADKNNYSITFSRKELTKYIKPKSYIVSYTLDQLSIVVDTCIPQTIDELKSYTVKAEDKTTDVLLFENVTYTNNELTLTYNINSVRKYLEPFLNHRSNNNVFNSINNFMGQLSENEEKLTFNTEEERTAYELEQYHKNLAMQMEKYKKLHEQNNEDNK